MRAQVLKAEQPAFKELFAMAAQLHSENGLFAHARLRPVKLHQSRTLRVSVHPQ